jgi:hypothetical protein
MPLGICMSESPRTYRVTQAGLIRTGQFVGRQKRRPTDLKSALSLTQVRNLTNALAFARNTGRPLNALLTIAWDDSRLFQEANWPRFQTTVLDQTSRQLKGYGIAAAFVWTRERARVRGAHTHVLIHLGKKPAEIAVCLRDYLIDRFEFAPAGIDFTMNGFGAHTPAMQGGLLRYVLKGFDHSAFRYDLVEGRTENIGGLLSLDHRGQQGMVAIKRAGVSQNLGTTSRKANGWLEISNCDALARILNPSLRGAEK